jgi:fructokinase|tara:strand:- start:134 stop:502 length:369 start_codon:yes stop_codon:yes gene_type:complete
MGCVETYLSGPSLEKYWVELGGKPLSLEEIIESFEHNPNVEYLKWRKEYLANFGMALSNVINIVDPDAVILGGGVSNISFLYDEGIAAVRENIFSNKDDTPILPNKLGDSAGVFGAALLGQY